MEATNRDYVYTWKIEDFSLCALAIKEKLVSPTFKAETLGGSEWYLNLYPRGYDIDNENFVALYLYRVDNDDEEVIDYELEMSNTDGVILRSYKGKHIGTHAHGRSQVIAKYALENEMKGWKKDILIVRCHLKNNNKSVAQLACGSEARTKIGHDCCVFQWSINYFDSCITKSIKKVSIRENTQLKFVLTAPEDNIEISIQRLDKRTPAKAVSCKISLMNLKGGEVETKKEIYMFKKNFKVKHTITIDLEDSEGDRRDFPSFSKRFLEDRADDIVKDNAFNLKCEVSVSTRETLTELLNTNYKVHSSTFQMDSFLSLQNDLLNSFKMEKNSDIELRVQSLIIPAHKYILCARSPVFNTMFEQNMLENETGIVDIEDIDCDTMNSFLEFLYTGCMRELKYENTKMLLLVADKYQVSSLVEKCTMFLKSELSVNNVFDVYVFSDMMDNEILKSSALKFVAEHSAVVLASEAWSNWKKENAELANEILSQVALDFAQ